MTRCETPALRHQRGLSYLWVLLTVAVAGIGSGMALEVYTTSVQRDKERELLFIGRQFRVAIERYHETQVQGRREYPMSLDDLIQDARMSGGKRHLRKIFVDPMTGKAEWGYVRMGGRIVGVHSLSEKAPIQQAHFEAEEVLFVGKKKYSAWVFTYPFDLLERNAPADKAPQGVGEASSSPLWNAGPSASAPERKTQ